MDRTSIPLGSATRDALKEYKEKHGLQNYNAAVQSLLADQEGTTADAPESVIETAQEDTNQ